MENIYFSFSQVWANTKRLYGTDSLRIWGITFFVFAIGALSPLCSSVLQLFWSGMLSVIYDSVLSESPCTDTEAWERSKMGSLKLFLTVLLMLLLVGGVFLLHQIILFFGLVKLFFWITLYILVSGGVLSVVLFLIAMFSGFWLPGFFWLVPGTFREQLKGAFRKSARLKINGLAFIWMLLLTTGVLLFAVLYLLALLLAMMGFGIFVPVFVWAAWPPLAALLVQNALWSAPLMAFVLPFLLAGYVAFFDAAHPRAERS